MKFEVAIQLLPRYIAEHVGIIARKEQITIVSELPIEHPPIWAGVPVKNVLGDSLKGL